MERNVCLSEVSDFFYILKNIVDNQDFEKLGRISRLLAMILLNWSTAETFNKIFKHPEDMLHSYSFNPNQYNITLLVNHIP